MEKNKKDSIFRNKVEKFYLSGYFVFYTKIGENNVKLIFDNIGILDFENKRFNYYLFYKNDKLDANISNLKFTQCKKLSFILDFSGYKKEINLKYRDVFQDYYFFGEDHEFFIKIIIMK